MLAGRDSEDLKRSSKPENLTVNSKSIFAVAGGIAAAAIVLFLVMGSGLIKLPSSPLSQTPQPAPEDVQLSLGDLKVLKKDDKTAEVAVSFNAFNPNKGTALLETVHYTVYVDKLRMTGGDIGVSPEGFVSSQSGVFPIVSNSTVLLKDSQTATVNNVTASAWNKMVAGQAQYSIQGSYAYQLTGSSFQFSTGEKDFAFTYP